MMRLDRPRCWVERVVDSDTLVIWLEATPDVRVRYRARIVGIEGGESHEPDGPRGTAAMAAEVAAMADAELFWSGSVGTRDQHGRLVGDIFGADGSRLSVRLLQGGTHWRRTRDGRQHRS